MAAGTSASSPVDTAIASRRKAEEFAGLGLRPSRYVQLSIDLNQIEFDHHWLFGPEDAAARRLRSLHSDYVLMCEQAASAWREYAEIRQQMELEIVGKEELQRLSDSLLEVGNRIDSLREDLPKVGRLMEAAYEHLEHLRQTSGLNTTGYRLEKIEGGAAEDEDGRPFEMPTYLLKRIHKKAEEEASGAATPGRAVRLVISERFDRNAWRDLAVVFVPFQAGGPTATPALEPMDFKNSAGCGEVGISPHLQGRVFCNAVWAEADANWLQEGQPKEAASLQSAFSLIPPETLLDAEVDDDLRLQALEKRYKNRHYAARGLDLRIGLHSNEIDHSLLADDWRTDDFASIGAGESGLDVMHELGHQYAINVRQQLVQSATSRRRGRSYQDIVREDTMPVLFGFFGSFFPPAGHPMRTQHRAKSGGTRHSRCKIVVNVQSATNLPEKLNGDPTNIFVDVVFRVSSPFLFIHHLCCKKQHAQTSGVEGRYANWQQTVVLELERDHDFDNWANVDDHFELRLYDRQLSGLDFDNRETNTIHEQVENRFLGHVLVPFSTVYAFGKVDGPMFVEKPLFHTDYRRVLLGFEKRSQLKLLITSDPPMQPPQLRLNEAFVDGGESAEIVRECQRWQARCTSRFPDRLLPGARFGHERKGHTSPLGTRNRSLRRISCANERPSTPCGAACSPPASSPCVPLVSHPIVCAHSTDLWMTVDQVLTIGCGSVEEHALLLMTWLLGLGYSVALVLGRALPEGANAAYLLVEIEGCPTFLINPCDAQRYALDDPTCPLFQIGTVITPTNVFGNVQAGHPSLTNGIQLHGSSGHHSISFPFFVQRKGLWDPLFADKRAANLPSVQKGTIVYTDIPDDLVMELRTGLEREIRVKFDQHRPYGIPQWNVLASRALRELLTELNETADEHQTADRAYTTKSQLVADILSTQMHVNANPLAQFAFAVHIQPFFNNIVSCSLAIACLQPSS
ncbi:C2 domain-containing protein [Aphelenchoides fujianensis]|nr:C2 domain-containing protein [Aphelenchoides fujianensis]